MVGPNAGVSRQEDPRARDEARRALHPDRAARDPRRSPAISMVMQSALSSLHNTGPHGLTEMTYAFTSMANNNGSAFAGLNGNTDWFNITGAIAMLVGRFMLMIPVLAIAGSLGRKQAVAAVGRHVPDEHAAVRGAAHRCRRDRRRPHVLPRRRTRPGRRATRRKVLRNALVTMTPEMPIPPKARARAAAAEGAHPRRDVDVRPRRSCGARSATRS